MGSLDSLLSGRPANAVLSWTLVAVLVATAVQRLLAGDVRWVGYAALVIAVAVVPAVVRGVPVVASWPVLSLAALPAVARSLGVFTRPMGYLSVAALGLLVVAEIDAFSVAEMPGWFAAALVAMATMTAASSWTVVRYGARRLLEPAAVPGVDAIMWDLVVASAVGLAIGGLFALVRDQGTVS